jgi:selenocysteine-specific elongation factor
VTFLCATAESEGKLRLLDRDVLLPGQEAWAQVALDSTVAVARGDHCIIRTSNDTAGGGVIVAVNPRRHRRNHAPTLDALARQLQGSSAERLLDLLLGAPVPSGKVAALLGLESTPAAEAIAELTAAGDALLAGDRLFARAWLDAAAGRAAEATSTYLGENSLKVAAPREHVRSASRIDAALFDTVVKHAVATGRLEERARELAPPGYSVELSARQQAAADAFCAALKHGQFSPPTDNLPEPALMAYLAAQGRIVDTGTGVVYDADVYRDMVRRVTAHIVTEGSISLGEARDLFDTSRKYAQAFLEHLDASHITRRVGDTRVLLAPSGATG